MVSSIVRCSMGIRSGIRSIVGVTPSEGAAVFRNSDENPYARSQGPLETPAIVLLPTYSLCCSFRAPGPNRHNRFPDTASALVLPHPGSASISVADQEGEGDDTRSCGQPRSSDISRHHDIAKLPISGTDGCCLVAGLCSPGIPRPLPPPVARTRLPPVFPRPARPALPSRSRSASPVSLPILRSLPPSQAAVLTPEVRLLHLASTMRTIRALAGLRPDTRFPGSCNVSGGAMADAPCQATPRTSSLSETARQATDITDITPAWAPGCLASSHPPRYHCSWARWLVSRHG